MFDRYGGAERVAWDLFQSLRTRGHDSWMAVGRKRSHDVGVHVLPNHQAGQAWSRFWWRLHARLQPAYGRFPGSRGLCRLVHTLAEPRGWLEKRRGLEDFHYPGTWRLTELTPRRPELIHCHNLHQNYFDLRALPWLSRQAACVLTLHDAWLLGGHCAHSFDCDAWKTGCAVCPEPVRYSRIRRDAAAANWRRKLDLYAASRLFVATPCQWLMDKVTQSILAAGVVESRVIPHGVDLTVFRPWARAEARARCGLPQDAHILLFAASGIRANPWKDFRTLHAAVERLGARARGTRLLFVALGEVAPPERIGAAEVRFVPFQSELESIASYYQAADLYVHAARADTFPNTILEALACGTPVVATAVGGIPEQVRCLTQGGGTEAGTGTLTPAGDAAALADAVQRLLEDQPLRVRLGENAVIDARERFDLEREVDDYLAWYREILKRTSPPQHTDRWACGSSVASACPPAAQTSVPSAAQ